MWILSILSCFLVLFTGSLKTDFCPPSDIESVLHPGYEYTYRFQSEAIVKAAAVTNDYGKIQIQCFVILSHTTECYYSLQLSMCSVDSNGGPPGAEVAWIADQPLSDLSKYPILFALINGEVPEVYTVEKDPIQFVNIKRGALTAFVFKLSNTITAKEELHTDIHGTCPLTVTPLDTSKGLVRTTKNMRQCAFPSRRDWQFSPYSLFWNMSFIQYVFNSTINCDYTVDIDAKRLNKVHCEERHAFLKKETSETEVFVESKIHYNMEHLSEKPLKWTKDLSFITRRTDIRYEYERTPEPTSNPETFLPVAKKLLAEMVEYSVDKIRLFTISQFTDFVAWMRSANDLVPFLDTVKSCSYLSEKECTPFVKGLGMAYLKDALIQCNTVPCYEAVSNLVKTKDISGEFLDYYAWGNMYFSKPIIIKYIMNICNDTDSNLCWASLGSLIRKIYLTYPDLKKKDRILLKNVAKNINDNIGRLCDPADPYSEEYSLLLRNLKTARNMGEIYLTLIPEGFQQLIQCVFNSIVPDFARAFALQTLRDVSPCGDEEPCDKAYTMLLPLLLNSAESTALRSLTYDHLIRFPQRYGFEHVIFLILETDGNLQLKCYIASNLKSLFKDSQFLKKEEMFVKALTHLLNENDLSLNSFSHSPEAKTFSVTKSLSVNIPSMPEGMKTIDLRTGDSEIYESPYVIPRYISCEVILGMFKEVFNAIRLEGYSEGLEKVAIVFQRLVKNYNSELPSFVDLLSALKEAVKEFNPEESNQSIEFNFQNSILRNIRRLDKLYKTFKPTPKSFFSVFIELFGTTVGYISSRNTATLYKLLEIQALLDDMERGLAYNSTRVLRVIEAYHQVPTMMGLPLNWTINGTVAFSLRNELNIDLKREEFHGELFTQPSAALTFLNRMVIDFPLVTQIGVQVNISAYTSTQWKAKLDYSKNKKMLSIIKPSKSIKILELFQTNQFIKQDTCEEIRNQDIERTPSQSSDDRVSLWPVLQALVARWGNWSLPTNPFYEKLMSDMETAESSYKTEESNTANNADKTKESNRTNNANSTKEFNTTNNADKTKESNRTYNANSTKEFNTTNNVDKTKESNRTNNANKTKEFFVKCCESGKENKRDFFLNVDVGGLKGETKVLVEVPEFPDFGISYIQNSALDQNEKREITIIQLKLQKGYEYRLIYNEEEVLDETGRNLSTNRSPQEEKPSLHYFLLSLDTPFNIYRFSKENHNHEDDERMKALVTYENLNLPRKWLRDILPESFWESDTKAWVEFEMEWKDKKIYSQSRNRRAVCSIKDPNTIIDLKAHSLEMNKTEEITINLSKTEISTGKLLLPSYILYELKQSLFDAKDLEMDLSYEPLTSRKFAMLFGPLHVYTFDGKVYDSAEYSSDCTFLLAHDLLKSSFSVLTEKNGIHILFPEMVIRVNKENKVFVNGSSVPSKLPIQSHNGKIVVRGSEIVEIWSPSLKVFCNSKDFVYALEMDELHNGATFGLLGDADGSSKNEFLVPEGEVTFDFMRFLSSYEVSGHSVCKIMKLRQIPIFSNETSTFCARQFKGLCRLDNNALQAFQDACKRDVEYNERGPYAATGYSILCCHKIIKSTKNCNVPHRSSGSLTAKYWPAKKLIYAETDARFNEAVVDGE